MKLRFEPRYLDPELRALSFYIFKDFYLFLGREEGWEKGRERNSNAWLPLAQPHLGT